MNITEILTELHKQRKHLSSQLQQTDKAIEALSGIGGGKAARIGRRKPQFSKAGLARIAAAQRARWAKWKAGKRSK